MNRSLKFVPVTCLAIALALGCYNAVPVSSWEPARPARLAKAETVTVRVREGTELAATMSPDGRSIAVIVLGHVFVKSSDSSLAVAPMDMSSDAGDAMSVAWSPNGQRIVVQNAHGLQVLDLAGRDVRHVSRRKDLWFPAWSRDGERILTAAQVGDSIVLLTYPSSGIGPAARLRALPGQLHYADYGADRMFAFTASLATSDGALRSEIRELDVTAGQLRSVTAVDGVATYPAFSPDGRWIAFIVQRSARRHLFMTSRIDGSTRQITHDTADIYNARPSWTPDSRAILYTAAGQIAVVSREGGSVDARTIPFAADFLVARWTGLRRPEVPTPGALRRVRGILHPELSPDGRSFVFSALGDLWIAGVDDTKPRRLTETRWIEETQPRWSADASRIAYVAAAPGRDRELRIISVDSSDGTRSFSVVPSEFAWSADGKRIAYTSQGAVGWIDVDSREAHAVAEVRNWGWATLVGWNNGGDSIVFSAGNGQTDTLGIFSIRRAVLSVSVRDSGRIDTVHSIPAKFAIRAGWTPDLAHVAYDDGGRGFHARSGATPVRISDPAPRFYSWTRDGSALLYMSGDRLRLLDVASAQARTLSVALSYRSAPAPHRVLIANVHVVDGRGNARNGPTDILIENGVVARIGKIRRPSKDVHLINGAGLTLMPGLFDLHTHLNRQPASPAYLYHGVLAVRDMLTTAEWMQMRRERAEADPTLSPRIFFSGGTVMGDAGWGNEQGNSHDRREVKRDDEIALADQIWSMSAVGVDILKVRERDAPLNARASRAAHRQRLPVTSHFAFPGIFASGLEGKEHAELIYRDWTAVWQDDVISLMRSAGSCVTPTLVADAINRLRFRSSLFPVDTGFLTEPTARMAAPADAAWLRQEATRPLNARTHELWEKRFRENLITVRRLRDAGVKLATGTDVSMPGRGIHLELQLLVLAGLTPLQAIRAATHDAAVCLGVEDRLGSVAPGMIADFLLIDGDPTNNVRALERIRLIILRGKPINRDEILPES